MSGTNLIDSARERGLHPFYLLLLCARKTPAFEAVWPAVDEELLKAVLHGDPGPLGESHEASPLEVLNGFGLSLEEARVVSWLHFKGYYGKNRVPFDKVHRHGVADGKPPKRTRETLKGLVEKQWINDYSRSSGEDAAYSLDPDRKMEAEGVDTVYRDLKD